MSLDGLPTEQVKAVNELRNRLKEEMPNDMFEDDNLFIRFLRARNFNIQEAESMIRNNIFWRRKYQIDSLLTDFTPRMVYQKYMTFDILDFDKDGYVVAYAQLGDLDAKGLIKSMSKGELINSILQVIEVGSKMLKAQSVRLDKTIDQWSFICNVENLTLAAVTHTPSIQLLIKLLQIYEANYPERLKAAYVINASVYLSMAFAMVKPFLSEKTVKKIKIFGKEGWKDELLRVMGADALPAFLGGKRVGPDGNPKCEDIISHGGMIPEHYYIVKSSSNILQHSGTRKLSVARMSKTELALEVDNPQSNIEWEFEVKNGDVDFSVVYKERPNDKNEEIIAKQRIDTGTIEKGMLLCKRPGIYILEFDNTYSWIYEKKVYCNAMVVNSTFEATSMTK